MTTTITRFFFIIALAAFGINSAESSPRINRIFGHSAIQNGFGLFTEINRFDDTINGVYWLGRARDASHPLSAYTKLSFKYADVTEEGFRDGFSEREAFIAFDVFTGLELSLYQLFLRAGIGWDLGELLFESVFESDRETESNIDTFFEFSTGLTMNEKTNLLIYAKHNSFNGITLDRHSEWYYGVAFEFLY